MKHRFANPSALLCALLLAVVLGFSGETASGQRSRAMPDRWEHESSDIAVRPDIRFGHLANGMRYAWLSNSEPDQRSYVRLHVDVGSLSETDAEQGMAHFLEHLAFNGSKRFPAGTLIEWFQKQGMAFGADTNASTSFSETIYMLDLPTSDEETLREGFEVLRDFADALLLEPEEVEAEKGVIDGEERERDSAGARTAEKWLRRMYHGTRYADRLPIGTKERRDAFTAKSVRRFYETWYRPENMTLLLVGDFEDYDPTALIKKSFSSMKAPESAPQEEPANVTPEIKGQFFLLNEEELPVLQLQISRLRPYVDEPMTVATMREDLPLAYARRIVNLRLRELAKQQDAPFLGATLGSATQFDIFDGEELAIVCAPEKWQAAMAACERELRRSLRYGFQEAELAELRADALRALDESVEREKTRSSASHVAALLAAAEHRYVPATAATMRSIMAPAIRELTVESCHRALVRSWNDGTLCITGSGNLDLGEDAGKQLLEAWQKSASVEVKAAETIESSSWAYASSAEQPGEIVERKHVKDLDLHLVRFANGVRLNLKKTDFKKNQVLVGGRLGEGRLTLPKGADSLATAGDSLLSLSGLGAHDEEQIRRLTAGKLVGFRMETGEDSFAFGGATTSDDLLMQLEMICAHLTDPGWREDGLHQMRRYLPQMFEALDHQHSGPVVRNFLPDLYGGDLHFRYPTEDELAGIEAVEIREWLQPHLGKAPLEVEMVGDFDVEEAISAAARTLGKLPARRDEMAFTERRKINPAKTGLRSTYRVDTEVQKSLVLVVFPTADGFDTTRRRTLGFLAQVVNDRLRLEVRERLGMAYSPAAINQSSTVFPGVGKLTIQVMADPAAADAVVEACLGVARSLATTGVTAEEVDRLRSPLAASIRDAMRSNSYWMSAIKRAQSDPGSLDDARSVLGFYESIDVAPLTAAAKKYLKPASASVLIVHPASFQPKSSKGDKGP